MELMSGLCAGQSSSSKPNCEKVFLSRPGIESEHYTPPAATKLEACLSKISLYAVILKFLLIGTRYPSLNHSKRKQKYINVQYKSWDVLILLVI